MVTCHSYICSLICKLLWETRFVFLFGYLWKHWLMLTKLLEKGGSVLKDLDIINRCLHNMQMNSSLLKRFWFSDVFHLWHHIAIYHNLTFHCWIMRSAIKQIIMCDAKWNCLHSDAKTLKWTLIAMKRIKHHSQT